MALSFLLTVISAQARNFYISSSTGNDSYTTAQAQSQSTPWKSISKLNSFFASLLAGDVVYFKRGEVFYGSIVATKSGSAGSPITITAYGSGDRPLISGFTTLTSWASVGNGIYQATATGISNTVNMVTVNNVPQALGRYPNANAVNGGYFNFESSTTSSITDNTLTSSTNWTGAELVIRKQKHVIEQWPIIGHSGGTITYQPGSGAYSITGNGYGYFIQKDIRCLDQFGEWFYNTSTKYLQMYFGTASPSSYNIKVSTADILLNTSRYSYITVSELAFEGANTNAINIGYPSTNTSNVSVSNCDIDLSGSDGVYATNADYPSVKNCKVANSYNNAIEIENEGGISTFATISRNNITNTGRKPGMAINVGNSHQAITSYSTDALIEYNNIDSTGYTAICFYYNNAKVRNNFITNFCLVKDDGGGINTWSGPVGGPVYTGREIKNNIIVNAVGAPYGTPNGARTAHGIYMDDGVAGVDISGNSVANTSFGGIYLHNAHEISVTNNTVYNGELQQILFVHDNITPTDPLRNITFTDNILVAKADSQLTFNIRSIDDDLDKTGVTDRNYYARPPDDDLTIGGQSSLIKTTFSLERWKANYARDANSKKSPKTIAPYKINSISANLLSGGDFLTSVLGLAGLSFWSQNSNQAAVWDGSSKLTGTGSLKISFPVVSTLYTLITKSIVGVSNTKNYIVRFSTLGTTANGMFKVYLKNSLTNTTISTIQEASFGTSRKDHEFLFQGPATALTANLLIELQQSSGTTYIDDIQMFEASETPVSMDDQMRFEYNATEAAKTVPLDGKYVAVDGTSYNGTLTLQPYTSKVLIRDGAVTATVLTTTATAPDISCFGGNTTVTVGGSGGTSPYKGTGTFAVNAGKGSLKIAVNTPVSNSFTALYASIGAVSSTKSYVLRFSTLGTTSAGSLRASLQQTNSPFAYITPTQTKTFGNSRVDHEFVFTAPTTTASASFLIEILQSSGTTYIDNIACFESTAAGIPTSINLYSAGQFENGISGITTSSSTSNHTATSDLTSKISNTYYYAVTDALGAISVATAAINQPDSALQASSTAGDVTVAGGTTTVFVTATGGTAPYTGTGSFSNVKLGTYNYTVTDAAGCSTITTVTVNQVLNGTFSAVASANDISCFGGSTTVTVSGSGGRAPYDGTGTYDVNAGSGTLKVVVASPVAKNYTSIYASIGTVASTKTYVLMFSTLGTVANSSLRASLRQTNSPWSYITATQTRSFGTTRVDHSFIFTAPASTADASFIIEILQSTGITYVDNIAFFEATATGDLISDNLFDGGQFENGIDGVTVWSPTDNHTATLDLTSKISNTYYYAVTDAAGSIAVATAEMSQPSAPLRASSSAGTITVSGGATTVVVTATGGTAPYTGTGSFDNVKPGTYNYTVTDAGGCSALTTITVSQSSSDLSAAATVPAIRCFGGTATFTVTASGGVAPYDGTGTYSVTAGKGTLRVSVASPVASSYTLLYSPIGPVSSSKSYVLRFSTLGTASGSLRASLRSSNPLWGSITAKQSKSFSTARVDHEFIFNAPTTLDDASFLIEIPQSAGTVYIDNIACFEATPAGDLISGNLYSGGQFESTISNIYVWSATGNHVAALDLTSKISNTYYYTISDAVDAVTVATAVTSQPAAALQAAATSGTVTSTGGTTTVVVTATGGTAPYSGTGNFTNVKVGTYNYTVTDARGCTSVVTITVRRTSAARIAGSTTTGSLNTSLSVVNDEATRSNTFKISSYPNPATTEFGLIVEGGSNEKVHVSVIAADGREMYQTTGNTNTRYAFGNKFVPGVYIAKVWQGNTSKVIMLVKGK